MAWAASGKEMVSRRARKKSRAKTLPLPETAKLLISIWKARPRASPKGSATVSPTVSPGRSGEAGLLETASGAEMATARPAQLGPTGIARRQGRHRVISWRLGGSAAPPGEAGMRFAANTHIEQGT